MDFARNGAIGFAHYGAEPVAWARAIVVDANIPGARRHGAAGLRFISDSQYPQWPNQRGRERYRKQGGRHDR